MTLIKRLIQLTILLLILGVIFHNWTAKFLLTLGLRAALGSSAHVGDVSIDLGKTEIAFRDIVVKNPSGFPDAPMAVIPLILVHLDAPALFKGKINFHEVALSITEVNVIRNRDGKVNLLSLSTVEKNKQEQQTRPQQPAPKGPPGEPVQWEIANLVLTLGKATYLDLNDPSGKERSFNLRIENQTYQHVKGMGDIVMIVVWETMKRVGISGLTNMLPLSPELKESLGASGILEKAMSLFNQ